MNIIASFIAIVSLVASSLFGIDTFNKNTELKKEIKKDQSEILEANVEIENLKQRQTDYGKQITELISSYVSSQNEDAVLGATNVLPTAGHTYTLFSSGVSSSASSIILSSLTLPQTGQKIVDSDLSTTFYLTLEPGNRSKQEIASCTTVVQNSNGTATLSGCTRGLSPIPPFTASTTLQFAHGGNSSVIFSDPPQFHNQYTAKTNDEFVSGLWSFTTPPIIEGTGFTAATTTSQVASRAYVNSVAAQGAATSTVTNGGIVELATGAEAAAGLPIDLVKPLVLDTSISSSTRRDGDSNRVVVTNSSGFIDPTLIATSSSGGATQLLLDIGTIRLGAATTTVNNLSATSSGLKINGVYLNFPSTQPASSTSLTVDANGVVVFGAPSVSTGNAGQPAGTTGNQIITHNLGRAPQLIEIHFSGRLGATCTGGSINGEFSGSGYSTSTLSGYSIYRNFGNGDGCSSKEWPNEQGANSSNIIFSTDAKGNTEVAASITAITTTTFTLNWSTNDSAGAASGTTRTFVWKAY